MRSFLDLRAEGFNNNQEKYNSLYIPMKSDGRFEFGKRSFSYCLRGLAQNQFSIIIRAMSSPIDSAAVSPGDSIPIKLMIHENLL